MSLIDKRNLHDKIDKLTPRQTRFIERMIDSLLIECSITNSAKSDFACEQFCEVFSHILTAHHAVSKEPFSKDKFEYALASALKEMKREAELAPKGNPGFDLKVGKEKWSLKTQADRNIKVEKIHISKFMELGKGRWKTQSDLKGLVKQFLNHLDTYDRIFTLRMLSRSTAWKEKRFHSYELVEIPKSLLARAKDGSLELRKNSTQTPKPGYCTINNSEGDPIFKLYFDGGTERKLQIKGLLKSECKVHCTWTIAKFNDGF